MVGRFGLLAGMQEAGFLPSVFGCFFTVDACEKSEQWSDTLGCWEICSALTSCRTSSAMTLPSKSLEETEQWSGAFGPLAVMQQAGILPHVLIRFVAINARDEDKQFLVVDLVLACWYLCIRMAANSVDISSCCW